MICGRGTEQSPSAQATWRCGKHARRLQMQLMPGQAAHACLQGRGPLIRGRQPTSRAHAAVVRKQSVTYTRVTTGSCSQAGTGAVRAVLSSTYESKDSGRHCQRLSQRHPGSWGQKVNQPACTSLQLPAQGQAESVQITRIHMRQLLPVCLVPCRDSGRRAATTGTKLRTAGHTSDGCYDLRRTMCRDGLAARPPGWEIPTGPRFLRKHVRSNLK